MKLWVDDVRPAPEGYVWCFSVEAAEAWIKHNEECVARFGNPGIDLIDIAYDTGHSGEYGRLLDWLEETGRNYPIRIHSANSVGVENMRRIIQRNNWKEIK